MQVYDHNKMFGGLENTITVRISPKELDQLSKGKIIEGRNKYGNKMTVILQIEENSQPTSSS